MMPKKNTGGRRLFVCLRLMELLFLRSNGKACVILAGWGIFSKKNPVAMVCHYYGKNRETVLQRFGGAQVAIAGTKGQPRLTGVCRNIPAERRLHDCGAHGVLRAAHCAVKGSVEILCEEPFVKARGKKAWPKLREWCS